MASSEVSQWPPGVLTHGVVTQPLCEHLVREWFGNESSRMVPRGSWTSGRWVPGVSQERLLIIPVLL